MTTAFAFALAAGLGAVARGLAGQFTNQHNGFAYGTLIVNVVGSFALGALQDISTPALTVLGIGFLGSFTTFSSFARDTVALLELKRTAAAASYLVLTVALSIAAAALGNWLA